MNEASIMLCPTEKQLKMITALSWQLRPYYLFSQWEDLSEKMGRLMETASKMVASSLIQRMLSVLEEKRRMNAAKVWIPMDYSLGNPAWQRNIARIASSFFQEEADVFEKLDPRDTKGWRELKNRVEREELKLAAETVPDEFENDTRLAQEEEQRWQSERPPYSQVIDGIDFLQPTPGIDY